MLWLIVAVPLGFLGLCTIAAMVVGGRADERTESFMEQQPEVHEAVNLRRCA